MQPSRSPRTRLHVLLVERGWTVERFCRAYADTASGMTVQTKAVSDRTVKRWIAGTTRPQPPACRVLERIFGMSVDDLLAPPTPPQAPPQRGPAAPDLRPATIVSAYGDAGARRQSGVPDLLASSGDTDVVADDAADALRFLLRSDDASPAEFVDLLFSDVRRLARSYGDQLTFLADDLLIARRAAFRLLDRPNPPARGRDLYFLAGTICTMLAHTARDLGRLDAALAYQNSALLCAERSGHDGLRLFARTEQVATAYWTGDYTKSAELAQLAAAETPSFTGSLSVLPVIQEARAWAATGRADLATAAIARAADLRDRVTPDDLDAIGGILSLPLPEQLGIVAGTAAWLPDAQAAERAAHHAIETFQTAAPHERSYNSQAIAHADLALARVRQGALDGAADAVRPVLDIPPERRVHQIQTSVTRVAHALKADRFHNSATARDTAAAIESFTSTTHDQTAGIGPPPDTDMLSGTT